MPFILNNQNDDELKKKQVGQNISGTSTVLSPNTNAPTPSSPKSPKSSGSFTNLQSYLDANKDNAEGMGNKIASSMVEQGDKTRTGIKDTEDEFNSLSSAGTLSNLSTAKDEASSITNNARTNGYNSQISDSEVNRFKEISNALYKGPSGLSDSSKYADAQNSVNKADEFKTNASTDEGRFGLLTSMFDKPNYSQGQKKLDNLLLTGNEKAKTSINDAAANLGDLKNLWENANTNASNLASDRKSKMDEVRNFSQQTLNSNRDARNTEVNSTIKDVQDHWNDEYNNYSNLLADYKNGSTNLTQNQLSRLGFNGDNQGAQYVLNNSPAINYLDLQTFDENKIISKDQQAQLAALDKLANQYDSGAISRFSNPDQAGTLSLDNNFKADSFGTAANKIGQEMKLQRESAKQQYANALARQSGQSVNDYWIQHYAEKDIDGIMANPTNAKYWGVPNITDVQNYLNTFLNKK